MPAPTYNQTPLGSSTTAAPTTSTATRWLTSSPRCCTIRSGGSRVLTDSSTVEQLMCVGCKIAATAVSREAT
jgi:hypothetical protein